MLLHSLGTLGVRFHDNLSTGIVVKLSRAAPFVSSHFTSRSLATALDGLATCGTRWADMAGGHEVKEAYLEALVAGEEVAPPAGAPRGLQGMTAPELAKTLDSLARMGVDWDMGI